MSTSIHLDSQASRNGQRLSPFLAKSGTLRTGEDRLPGYYCEQQQMWVVTTDQGPLPIINQQALSQLQTKTRVREEEDDDTHFALELMTKTFQQMEGDDEGRPPFPNHLLELVTKTETAHEADDNYAASHLLEIITKTNNQQEQDDDGFQSFGFHS